MAKKTIWYKRAALGTIKNQTLQAVLSASLGKLPTTGSRLRRLQLAEPADIELINGFGKRYGMLCGHFITFEAGRKQPFLKGADSATAFDLDALAPPKGKANERREFLEGVLYFAVLDNHVLLCQSKAAGSREFERYLNWLLWEATSSLPTSTVVALSDQPSKQLVQKINNHPIKAVTFGTPMEYEPVSGSATKSRVTSVKVSPKGLGADVLDAIFSGSVFDRAGFDEAIEEDNIEVEVTVRFKHKRQISETGDEFLRKVAKAARHMNPEDVQIELHKAGTIRGDELRVHNSVEVETTDSGLVKEDDLNQRMKTWLTELLESKMIDP